MRFCLVRHQDVVGRIVCKPGQKYEMLNGELKSRSVPDESILVDQGHMLGM